MWGTILIYLILIQILPLTDTLPAPHVSYAGISETVPIILSGYLIISFLEYLKSWISIRIARNNQQIQRASNEPEIISSIGLKPTEEVEPEE